MKSNKIYCDSKQLKDFIITQNGAYIEIENQDRIENFWESSSNFLCYMNRTSLSEVAKTFTKYFTLPDKVREVKKNYFLNYFIEFFYSKK